MIDDESIIKGIAAYLEENLSKELSLREILAKAGYNNPKHSVEECLNSLVEAYVHMNFPVD